MSTTTGGVHPLLSGPLVNPASEETASDKVGQVASRSILKDLGEGLCNSATLQSVVVSAAISALATGALFFVLASPPMWMIIAVAAGGVAIGLLLGAAMQERGFVQTAQELSALGRMYKTFRGEDSHEIADLNNDGGKLYLRQQPNKLTGDMKRLKAQNVGTVLEALEHWETENNGLSLPLREKDYEQAGIAHKRFEVKDHSTLDVDTLTRAVEYIDERVKEAPGKSISINCQAGKGRSAQIAAAWLVKQGYTVDAACELITKQRPCSTVSKKKDGLLEFEASLSELTPKQRQEIEKHSENKK